MKVRNNKESWEKKVKKLAGSLRTYHHRRRQKSKSRKATQICAHTHCTHTHTLCTSPSSSPTDSFGWHKEYNPA